jgi:hypothetical protein
LLLAVVKVALTTEQPMNQAVAAVLVDLYMFLHFLLLLARTL